MESDSQNILPIKEFTPPSGTVLPATHGNTDDPTFFLWLSNIYEKCIFQSNSNKILKTKNLHIKYIKSVSVIMHMFERLNEVLGYSGYIWTL